MTKKQRNTGGLIYEETPWSNWWTGTAEQLVEAGACEMHQLPGQPGRNKNCVTYGTPIGRGRVFEKDEHYMQIQRAGKHRYRVVRYLPPDEERRRSEAYYAEHLNECREQKRLEIEKEKNEKNKRICEVYIGCLHESADRYKNSLLNHVACLFSEVSGDDGYRLRHPEAGEKIKRHLEAIRAIVSSCPVTFDSKARAAKIRAICEEYNVEPPTAVRETPTLRLVK